MDRPIASIKDDGFLGFQSEYLNSVADRICGAATNWDSCSGTMGSM